MVPVYNVERYLPQCLDSILAQDYQNLDILLVDDGSTDGCGAMCDSYAPRDPRMRVLHTKNQGLAATRNVCLAHAIADLLLFVDADDWVEPNTVSTLVGTMHATSSDMVCCERIPEWQDGPAASARDDQPVRTLEGEKTLAGLLRGTISNAAWGKLCRAKVLLGIDYPNGHAYEDVFTTHLICKQIQKVTCLPDTLFHYRIRTNGICRTRSASNLVDYWLAHTRRQEDLQGVPDGLQTILMENNIFAVFRTWCWLASCPVEDRRAACEEIHAMCHFARENLPSVLLGKFGLMTKTQCVACTVPSMAVWTPLNLLIRARGRVLGRMTPYE